MPFASQAQARFAFANPRKFGGAEHIASKLRQQGGMGNLPSKQGRNEAAKRRLRRLRQNRRERGSLAT